MELEALYEGLCRREPDLFEPESLGNAGSSVAAVRGLAEARLCGGVYGCRPAVDLIITACRPTGRGLN